jgi:thiamine pyrophosphate-dependent acetolactate synthase large subunit-like protein
MGKPKPDSAVEMAISQLRAPRLTAWWHRIDQQHQPTLDELEAAWKDGRLGSRLAPAADAIAKTLKELGIATVGRQGVQNWLRRKA